MGVRLSEEDVVELVGLEVGVVGLVVEVDVVVVVTKVGGGSVEGNGGNGKFSDVVDFGMEDDSEGVVVVVPVNV